MVVVTFSTAQKKNIFCSNSSLFSGISPENVNIQNVLIYTIHKGVKRGKYDCTYPVSSVVCLYHYG